jgi:hypothetical protein
VCNACAPARAEWLRAIAAAARANAKDPAFAAAVTRSGMIAAWAQLPYRFDGATDAVPYSACVKRRWAACQDVAAGALALLVPSEVWLLVESEGQYTHVRAAAHGRVIDPFSAWTPRRPRRVDFAIRGDAVLRGETLLRAAHGVAPVEFLRGAV